MSHQSNPNIWGQHVAEMCHYWGFCFHNDHEQIWLNWEHSYAQWRYRDFGGILLNDVVSDGQFRIMPEEFCYLLDDFVKYRNFSVCQDWLYEYRPELMKYYPKGVIL